MNTLYLILFIVSALCFLGAVVSHPSTARVNLVALGLFAWVLVPLIQRIDIMN
jgi:hypothetical protein